MLLQKNIVKKYLNLLGEDQTVKPWEQYQRFFLNEDIQANIHKIKEEQFQEGFLRELFVKVLGYTINPSPNYNLTTEQKNEVGSKKADGAILINDVVIGVIELKDHKTPDLASIELQAFGYKSKHKDTRLVIISNFEKLRLYIDNAVEFREWDIFHMTLEEFRELYLCLAWQQVEQGVVLRMKQESVSNEDQITKALYKDYSQFKRVLFADILANNPVQEGNDEKEWQLLLFKKTQKLLDRLLFIFFAEDCFLLQPNSMVQIIDKWQQLKDLDAYVPLYDRIKQYFGYLDKGHVGKPFDVYAYNGGLFKPDEVLDNIIISDDILAENTRRLSAYDFESDVDVNILGHIFENSLSEIEEVTQQINSGKGTQTSKRKQDGVFYTPQYITKYIVENTVGRLCEEKKKQLNIVEDEYLSDKRRQLQTKKRLLDQLQQYRKWLLEITILDPACGSGAFLNAALQFLMAEHKHIDEMEAKVTGSTIVFQDVENSILEHNLYGVDINEESVGIAQLALWLRTAKPHRKLNSLNENIKCGNSLISDPAIAGDKAFDWQKEFPKVFERGGFDVVIGNPPYVSAPTQVASPEMSKQRQAIIDSGKFKSLFQKWDLYIPFIELGIRHLCKEGGATSMIVPYPLNTQLYAQKSREMLLDEFSLYEVSDLKGTKVFEDASVTSTIFFVQKGKKEQPITISKIEDGILQPVYTKEHDTILQDKKAYVWNLDNTIKRTNRYDSLNVLGDFCYVSVGMVLNADENVAKGEFVKDDLISEVKDDIHCKEYVEGKDLERYFIKRVRYLEYGTERCPAKIRRKTFPELYTNRKLVINGLGNFKVVLDDIGTLCSNHKGQLCILWKDLHGIENTSIETSIKKFCRFPRIEMETLSYDCDLRYLLAILNSKYAIELLNNIRGGDMNIYPEHIRNIPIPHIQQEAQQPFVELADTMLSLNQKLHDKRTRFLRRLTDNFEGMKITTTLQQFDQLDFKGLMAELKKQKIHIPVKEQDEWEDFFRERVAECQELSAQIKATDEEINNLVFDLYGLTEEERRIVMES
jgi:type I restriction-modification system DNA methylase subunit